VSPQLAVHREEILAALNRELARLEEDLGQCKTGIEAKATTAALSQVRMGCSHGLKMPLRGSETMIRDRDWQAKHTAIGLSYCSG
jgi:hypothetical protein